MSLILPKVSANTTMQSLRVPSGGEVGVRVTVTGDTQSQLVPVPKGIVLIVDVSGSMRHGNRMPELKNAALALLSKVNVGIDQVALVEFSTGAQKLIGPTVDIPSVAAIIPNLFPQELTNISAGLELGATALRTINTPIRFGLLFTDGRPEPDPGGQVVAIQQQLRTMAADWITVHTVGLGDCDESLLRSIASETGGSFARASSESQLVQLFERAYDSYANVLTARDVVITERIAPRFVVKPGSLSWSLTATGANHTDFDNAIRSSEASFYQTGELTFPSIGVLGARRDFTYGYVLRANRCDPRRDDKVPVRLPGAGITYLNGGPARAQASLDRGGAPSQITIAKCGVDVAKSFDESDTRTATIVVTNSFSRPIRDIALGEVLEDGFEVGPGPIVPLPASVSRPERIYWSVSELAPNGRYEVTFQVADSQPLRPMGSYDLQGEDAGIRWLFERPRFTVDTWEPDFRAFESNILGTGGASVIEKVFQAKLNLAQLPIGAIVSQAPPTLQTYELKWQVDFAEIEVSALASADGDVSLPKFYVARVEDGGLEVFQEIQANKRLPQYTTAANYQPR